MDDLTLSIGDLARRTGVDIPTLRRWERYEGLLAPTRTPGGQRRYGAGDVAAVEELVSLIAKGWAVEAAARAVADHRDTGAVVFDASLLDAVPAGVVVTNAANQVLYANPAIAAMLGVTTSEVLSADGGAFLDGEAVERVLEAFEHLRSGEPQTYEVRMVTRSGDHIDVEVSAGPLIGPAGHHRGVVGVFHDLTRLRASEHRASLLSRMVDATDEALVAVDEALDVVSWNAAAAAAYPGITAGRAFPGLLPPDLVPLISAAIRRALDAEESTFELRARDRDGVGPPVGKRVRVVPHIRVGAVVAIVDVVPQLEPAPDDGTGTAYHGVLATLTQSVLTGDPLETILDTAVRGVARALDASHVSFFEALRGSGDITVLASTAPEAHAATPTEPFGSHVGFALQSQRPIIVPDFDVERRFDRGPFAGEQVARSGLCVPVRWRDDGVGAMSVHVSELRRDLGTAEVTFVQSAANVCAIALQGRIRQTSA